MVNELDQYIASSYQASQAAEEPDFVDILDLLNSNELSTEEAAFTGGNLGNLGKRLLDETGRDSSLDIKELVKELYDRILAFGFNLNPERIFYIKQTVEQSFLADKIETPKEFVSTAPAGSFLTVGIDTTDLNKFFSDLKIPILTKEDVSGVSKLIFNESSIQAARTKINDYLTERANELGAIFNYNQATCVKYTNLLINIKSVALTLRNLQLNYINSIIAKLKNRSSERVSRYTTKEEIDVAIRDLEYNYEGYNQLVDNYILPYCDEKLDEITAFLSNNKAINFELKDDIDMFFRDFVNNIEKESIVLNINPVERTPGNNGLVYIVRVVNEFLNSYREFNPSASQEKLLKAIDRLKESGQLSSSNSPFEYSAFRRGKLETHSYSLSDSISDDLRNLDFEQDTIGDIRGIITKEVFGRDRLDIKIMENITDAFLSRLGASHAYIY